VKSVEICQILYNIEPYELSIEYVISVVRKTDRIRGAMQWISKCDISSEGELRITIQM
jgi:hypothetical protein